MKLKQGILFSFIAVTFSMLVSSCKEDIDLTGDAKETAVIYGLLNQADSVHFVKINRAFISNDNSLITAQIPDSNYFQNIDATIKEIVNGNVVRTWILKDTIIENKEPGVFYAPEQKLYYFKTTVAQPLIANANTQYKLDVSVNEGEFAVSGITKLIAGMSITQPQSYFTFATSDVATKGYATSTVGFNKGDAFVANVKIQITIKEYIGSNFTTKILDWNLGDLNSASMTTATNLVNANGKTFYTVIRDGVTNDPNITKRMLKSIKVILTGGSEDLEKYMKLAAPSSSLAQTKPTFTNLTATNDRKVVGIFSARSTTTISKEDWILFGVSTYKVAIDKNSMKELGIGSLTGSLLFCTDNPQYNIGTPEQYFCN
jgi:hypothetical protein